MDRSQGRKRNVKRNGVWQPPMEKKMTDGRNSPEEEQNTSNSSEEQHLSVSTPMQQQENIIDQQSRGRIIIVRPPPIVTRPPPPIWIRPISMPITPVANLQMIPPVQLRPTGLIQNRMIGGAEGLSTQVLIHKLPSTSQNPVGCFKIVSDEMASDQIQSGPEALPELNRDDLMEILAEQENEMNEELQEDAKQIGKIKITTDVQNIKLALKKKLPIWPTIAYILAGAQIHSAEATTDMEGGKKETGETMLWVMLMMWVAHFIHLPSAKIPFMLLIMIINIRHQKQ